VVVAGAGGRAAKSTCAGGGDAGRDHSAPVVDGGKPDTSKLPPGNDASLTKNHDAGHDAGPGQAHGCDISCSEAGGKCVNNACVINENPGALTPAQQGQLQGGSKGDAASSFTWLYPYDKTVFPRGLIPPTMQFGGPNPDGVLVHITYSSMDYTGFYGASSPGRVKLSDTSWQAITYGAAPTDDVVVAVTILSGSQVLGPVTESWTIAQGSMRGQIYYETYGSKIIGGAGGVGIMSIAPGASAPTVIAHGCGNVCHTASADGSTLVSGTGSLMDFESVSYDLKTSPVSTIYTAKNESLTYGGLYPDGSFAMSSTNFRTWMGLKSQLYNTQTGAQISSPSWNAIFPNSDTLGGTTAFSPDGTFFVFNRNDLDQGMGHYLWTASFSASGYSFSNASQLYNDNAHTLAWPSFTPDNATVVYHAGIGGVIDGGTGSGYETDQGATADLYRIDLATKTPVRLDWLDGYGAGGKTYLPASDPDMNFTPTVLPEAVGGYFWVIFTSHRSYGNILPSQDNGDENGKLWVAALDQKLTQGQDSSHPAFYLDGQEQAADCLRGFWVLPPCKQNGNACGSGDECCTGFCRADGEGGAWSCVAAPTTGCSNEYEKCTQTSDCCQANEGYSCIGGYCAAPPPK